MKVKSNLFSLVIYIYLARFSNFHSRTWNSSFVWPRFLCLSTKPIRLASINPGSCKKSITLFKAVITLAQWAWNRLLAGNSFKGVSMKAVKYRWYSGYFLKNLKFVIRWNVGINRSSGGRERTEEFKRGEKNSYVRGKARLKGWIVKNHIDIEDNENIEREKKKKKKRKRNNMKLQRWRIILSLLFFYIINFLHHYYDEGYQYYNFMFSRDMFLEIKKTEKRKRK